MNLLSGLMVAAIVLAVAFYGIVAYATIRPDGKIDPEPQTSRTENASGTESRAPESTPEKV
ncbi:MAG: hypothetical protein ILO68_07910 [Clostridia bacterium]|nr:hypothetical protein [Clostridia bacterium]